MHEREGDCNCSDGELYTSNKRLRFVDDGVGMTLEYNPRSYSMPDLLEIYMSNGNCGQCRKYSGEIAGSPNSNDIYNYIPKQVTTLKRKISNGLKRFKSNSTLDVRNIDIDLTPETTEGKFSVYTYKTQKIEELTKTPKAHKLLRPFKSLNIFNRTSTPRQNRSKTVIPVTRKTSDISKF